MEEDIEIRLIRPTDRQSLIDFLKRQLPRNGTPVMLNLDLTPDDVDHLAERRTHEALMQPEKIISYLATDNRSGAIIAVRTAYFVDPSTSTAADRWEEKSSIPVGPKMQTLIDFWRLMLSGLAEFLPFDHKDAAYLMSELTVVDPEYRRFGFMKKSRRLMLERAFEKFGCKYAFGLCTSYKSILSCENENWTTMRWIRYEDYYSNGKRVFDFGPRSPEKYVKLVMGEIERVGNLRKNASVEKAKL